MSANKKGEERIIRIDFTVEEVGALLELAGVATTNSDVAAIKAYSKVLKAFNRVPNEEQVEFRLDPPVGTRVFNSTKRDK